MISEDNIDQSHENTPTDEMTHFNEMTIWISYHSTTRWSTSIVTIGLIWYVTLRIGLVSVVNVFSGEAREYCGSQLYDEHVVSVCVCVCIYMCIYIYMRARTHIYILSSRRTSFIVWPLWFLFVGGN
jgi:hypothetical protein